MRRCSRVSCFVLFGLFAAATAATGAYPAAGGHQGKGHALAKGHGKHAAAAPQLSQPAPAEPARKSVAPAAPRGKVEFRGNPSAPGVAKRHNHLTICHLTGSGRYIVISPDVSGAMHGHLAHHDDFVYVDGCERPARAPQPTPTPDPGTKPPAEGTTEVNVPAGVRTSGELPFTGLPAGLIALLGASLVAAGAGLRRLGRS